MLREIEQGGETIALDFSRRFDEWDGEPLVSPAARREAARLLPERIKADIAFAHRQVKAFAEAQRASIGEFQTELRNGLTAGQKLVPMEQGDGRVAAMEILQNTYAVGNLIRTRKLEQLYSHLQTRTKDIPEERMLTMESSLARLVQQGKIAQAEAEKWANNRLALNDLLNAVQ